MNILYTWRAFLSTYRLYRAYHPCRYALMTAYRITVLRTPF